MGASELLGRLITKQLVQLMVGLGVVSSSTCSIIGCNVAVKGFRVQGLGCF